MWVKVDFVASLGKRVIFEGENELCKETALCSLYVRNRKEEKKTAVENGHATIARQSAYNAWFEGWNGFVDYKRLDWCPRNCGETGMDKGKKSGRQNTTLNVAMWKL